MKRNYYQMLTALVMAAAVASAADAASGGTRDKFKSDNCQTADGKKIDCDAAEKPAAKYPNATRTEPAFPKSKISKQWEALVKAVAAGEPNAVIASAQAVIDNPDASNNEKSEAAYQTALTYLKIDNTAFAKPVEYSEMALKYDGLTNNQQYSLMLVLSQMQLAQKNYEQALSTINRYAKETGINDLAVEKVRGNSLYRLGRFAEAAPVLQKAYDLDKGADPNLGTMLMDSYVKIGQKAKADKIAEQAMAGVDPNDSAAQLQQLQVLANAKQYQKAAQAFDTLYAQGKITTLAGYEAGYVSYLNLEGKEAQAAKIINDGIAKGVIVPDAAVYNLLGQANYYSNNADGAIQAWSKGAALAKDGEQNRMLAQVYCEESRYSECKAAAQKALSQGVKNKGDVYLVLAEAESEFGLDNRTAMIAALKEAAKYPESQAEANKRLKQAGAK